MSDKETTSKKQRLLLAALAEFAEYGISGARMDRLAKRAGVSAGLVYTYFTNKDGLFDAVYDAIVAQTVEAIPITADDLGAYAGRLYDGNQEHPDVMRFIAWYTLERGATAEKRPSVERSMAEKVA
ncbi:TetR/AcrR family transcriptional regulator, partial [Nocardiopsis protaetiae]